MNSMTGHGRGTADGGGISVAVEITSVNKRALDVQVKVPRGLDACEAPLEARVRAALSRGSVRVVCEASGPSLRAAFSWDEPAALDALARLRSLAERGGVSFQPDAAVLLELAREHRTGSDSPISAEILPLLERALDAALAELAAMRRREGEALRASLSAQVERLRGWTSEMRQGLSGIVSHHREQLLRRLREAGLDLDVSDERLLKEIALFADRSDVSEELTRLESHFSQFGQLLRSDEPVGRKIEFLLQETHREFNTLGSKSPSVAVTRLVMECKNELERMKEQAANVE